MGFREGFRRELRKKDPKKKKKKATLTKIEMEKLKALARNI